MSELKEILEHYFNGPYDEMAIDEIIEKIKEWALSKLPKEKEQTGFVGHNGDDNPQFSDEGYEIMGYNQAIAEMRKSIEESEEE